MTDEYWPYVIEPAITKPRVGTSHTCTPGQDANFAQCPIIHPYLGRSTEHTDHHETRSLCSSTESLNTLPETLLRYICWKLITLQGNECGPSMQAIKSATLPGNPYPNSIVTGGSPVGNNMGPVLPSLRTMGTLSPECERALFFLYNWLKSHLFRIV